MSGHSFGHDEAVDGREFERVRTEICASGSASEGDDLLGMEMDCCAFLGGRSSAADGPGLWRDMEVRRDEGAEWLIVGRAVGEQGDAQAIAMELVAIWDQHLRYRFRSAHSVRTAVDAVTFRAVTQVAEGGLWVTAGIRVTLS